MAIQVINPVDSGFPIESLTVETDTETEAQFAWVSLLCCSYGVYATSIDSDWEEDIDV